MNSLDSLKIVRWKTEQSFVSGNWFFLGFSGISGVESAFGTWAKKTRASGLNGHGKRGNAERERREMNPFFGNPRILFIGRQVCLGTRGVRSYALRTRCVRARHAWPKPRLPRFGWDGFLGYRVGWDGLLGRWVGWDAGSDGTSDRTGRTGRTGRFPRIWRRGRSEANPLGYAGRTGVRSAYFGEGRWLLFGLYPNFELNK